MGNLFSDSVAKTGVVDPSTGTTDYYNNPAAAGMEMARRARALAQNPTVHLSYRRDPWRPMIATFPHQMLPGKMARLDPDLITSTPTPRQLERRHVRRQLRRHSQRRRIRQIWRLYLNPKIATTKGKMLGLVFDAMLGASNAGAVSFETGRHGRYPSPARWLRCGRRGSALVREWTSATANRAVSRGPGGRVSRGADSGSAGQGKLLPQRRRSPTELHGAWRWFGGQ